MKEMIRMVIVSFTDQHTDTGIENVGMHGAQQLR